MRKQLLNDHQLLKIEDFGAGSRVSNQNERSVSSIAKNALMRPKYAQLLFRIQKHYQFNNVLELGTSLGVTTCYLAAADPTAKVITIEGSTAIVKYSQAYLSHPYNNITQINGAFDDVLETLLTEIDAVGLTLIDGNHTYAATIRYFHALKKKCNNSSILIFDDIHWSDDMEKAWKEIQMDEAVTLTIDLFFIGIVFFKTELQKENYCLRF